jgi:4-hydroxy-2-oxoheptanedioate aldolase
MFRENSLKRRLAAGKPALGCWLFTGIPTVAEIIGHAGYDFVLIDHEHGPGDMLSATAQLQALTASASTAMMRVPWNDPVEIKRAVDIGVEGVMVPMVDTAEQAQAAVAACKYPPEGIRGCASSVVRGSDYGLANAEYLTRVNDEIVVMCQIETERAVDNIPEIASVEGVDVLFIGPNDLAASIGRPGRTDDPEARRLIERAEEAIKASGKKMAAVGYAGMGWPEMFARGYDLIPGASDVGLLRNGAAADVAAHRNANG